MGDVVPLTIDEYRKLDGEGKRTYHEWQNRQREQDRKEVKQVESKIYYHQNREKVMAYNRKWRRKNEGTDKRGIGQFVRRYVCNGNRNPIRYSMGFDFDGSIWERFTL